MRLINYIYLLLILNTKYIWTYQCLKCATEVFDHPVTSDNLALPTEDDCNVVTATHGCYVHINWQADGTTEVYYGINPSIPYDSIWTTVERQVLLDTGEYSTRKSIGYSCRSNRTACNTITNIKRLINSITFPTNEQKQQLDLIIAPTKNLNTINCSRRSNRIDCPKTNFSNCQQCMSVVQYSRFTDICSICSTGSIKRNFFIYHSLVVLNLISPWQKIIIGCQNNNTCNSMKNIEQIKRTLAVKLDLEKFYRSTASIPKTTARFLCMIIFTELCRLMMNK